MTVDEGSTLCVLMAIIYEISPSASVILFPLKKYARSRLCSRRFSTINLWQSALRTLVDTTTNESFNSSVISTKNCNGIWHRFNSIANTQIAAVKLISLCTYWQLSVIIGLCCQDSTARILSNLSATSAKRQNWEKNSPLDLYWMNHRCNSTYISLHLLSPCEYICVLVYHLIQRSLFFVVQCRHWKSDEIEWRLIRKLTD